MLKGKGCTGGPDSPSDGNTSIFSCPGVGRLVVPFLHDDRQPDPELAFQIIEQQLRNVGIELIPRFQTAGSPLRLDAPVQ